MPRKRTTKRVRRVRGTGSVFYDTRRKKWCARVPNGRKPNGKLAYKELRGDTLEEVAERAAKYKPLPPGVTLADWSKRWLESLGVRDKTVENYDVHLRCRVLPALGHMPLRSITAFHCEEALRKWQTGRAACGPTTARDALLMLGGCLQAALRAELIDKNPARLVKRPPPSDPTHDIFTVDELRRIVRACQTDRRLFPVALCAGTGCRIGEAIAWTLNDYDARTGELGIRRTALRGGKFGPPKSRHSTRVIVVPPEVRFALALPPDTACYDTLKVRWTNLLKRLELRHRGLHQLRHTVISHCIAQGRKPADVAKYMGDSAAVIIKVYCHPTGDDVSGAISGFLSGARVAPEVRKDRKSHQK